MPVIDSGHQDNGLSDLFNDEIKHIKILSFTASKRRIRVMKRVTRFLDRHPRLLLLSQASKSCSLWSFIAMLFFAMGLIIMNTVNFMSDNTTPLFAASSPLSITTATLLIASIIASCSIGVFSALRVRHVSHLQRRPKHVIMSGVFRDHTVIIASSDQSPKDIAEAMHMSTDVFMSAYDRHGLTNHLEWYTPINCSELYKEATSATQNTVLTDYHAVIKDLIDHNGYIINDDPATGIAEDEPLARQMTSQIDEEAHQLILECSYKINMARDLSHDVDIDITEWSNDMTSLITSWLHLMDKHNLMLNYDKLIQEVKDMRHQIDDVITVLSIVDDDAIALRGANHHLSAVQQLWSSTSCPDEPLKTSNHQQEVSSI